MSAQADNSSIDLTAPRIAFSLTLCLPCYSVFLIKDIMARKDRDERGQGENSSAGVGKESPQSSDGPVSSRRQLLKKTVVGAAVTAVLSEAQVLQNVATGVATVVLDHIIGADDPIPPDLQQTTTVAAGQQVQSHGYGHSIMAGVGAENVPLVEREASQLRERGMDAHATSFAEAGSTVHDLAKQRERAVTELQPKGDAARLTEVMTGGNELRDHPTMIQHYKAVERDPLNLGEWGQLRDDAQRLAQELGTGLRKEVGQIVRDTDSDAATLYRIPNEQNAQAIEIVGPGGRTTDVPVGGTSLTAKVRQAIIATVVRQGNHEIDQAARDVGQDTGVPATVISARVHPRQFTQKQHFNADAADDIAQRRTDLIEENNT